MNILIIGNGGREHALTWAVAQDPRVKKITIAPGNAGTLQLGENLPVKSTDLPALLDWAIANKPDLTIVGPEAPLCAGIVDLFQENHLPIFGPNRSAARLEGSKIFTKNILTEAGIPTAQSRQFSNSEEAFEYIQTQPLPLVFKADGLASGKGVIIAWTLAEAEQAVQSIMVDRKFGIPDLLVEEYLEGQEMSVHAVTDGTHYKLLPSSQDHKRLLDHDEGPNTGGMGAYAPSPLFTPENQNLICQKIFDPLLKTLQKNNILYQGVLYAGLMMTSQGPKVLEFNCRFGDPETQVLLPLLRTPLLDVIEAVIQGSLDRLSLEIKNQHALTIVMASKGYPESPETGKIITGLDQVADIVFHAATKLQDDDLVTSGGRVLTVTALAGTLQKAHDQAYQSVQKINFDGAHYRKDIGHKALKNYGKQTASYTV